MTYILFDIGGTKTRVALSRDLQSVETIEKFETPAAFVDGIEALVHAAETLAHGNKITAIAGGIRGPINEKKTTIVSETVLCDWVCQPIQATLSRRLHAPTYLENDAALVALGEAHYGAGKGHDIVAYLTVSTGVGGARVVNGVLDEARTNFEPGHQIVDIDGTVRGSKRADILQDLISGESLEAERGVKPYEISQDDPVWDTLAGYLGYGIKNTIVYWSPDIVVLGGSMIVGNPRILLSDIVRHTADALGDEQRCPPIVDAVLRDEGGLYGALALLRQKE